MLNDFLPYFSEKISGSMATGSFFSTLGVAPVLGRFFGPADDTPGGAPVVVQSMTNTDTADAAATAQEAGRVNASETVMAEI